MERTPEVTYPTTSPPLDARARSRDRTLNRRFSAAPWGFYRRRSRGRRMNREVHVRFCESPGVKPPGATRRLLRGPVLCRKNYYVNGAEWAADLAACLWSIFATVQIYGINPVTYLTAYFTACARNGGRPLTGEALDRFLPWKLSDEEKKLWSAPPPRPTPSATAGATSPQKTSA